MKSTGIIIVEDQVTVAMDIEMRLSALGYAVLGIATNEQELEALSARQAPDLVLMDINLNAARNGIQLAGQISAQGGPPVVFLTAFSDGKTFTEALDSHPFGYVVKPFEDQALQRAIEVALHQYKKQNVLQQSDKLVRFLLDHRGQTAALLDAKKIFRNCNAAFEQLSGYLSNELAGKSLDELLEREPDEQVLLRHRNGRAANTPLQLQPLCEPGTGEAYAWLLAEPASREQDELVNQGRSVFIREKHQHFQILVDDIIVLEALDNYTRIETAKKIYTVKLFLKDVLSKMPAPSFIRVHRSFGVNFIHITHLEEETLYLGKRAVPVGRQYREELMNRINVL